MAQEKARKAALRAAKEEAAAVGGAAVVAAAAGQSSQAKKAARTAIDYEAAAAAAARAAELAHQKRAAKAEAANAAGGGGGASSPPVDVSDGAGRGSYVAGGDRAAGIPTSSQQFDREWAVLKAAGAPAEERAAWLGRMPVDAYAPLFKESLTEETLVSVVESARDYAQGAAPESEQGARAAALATDVLAGLASTRRFELLTMFLDGKQKAAVQATFQQLKRLGAPAPVSLAKAWGVKS